MKLVYTPALGAGTRKGMEVQVLSPAPFDSTHGLRPLDSSLISLQSSMTGSLQFIYILLFILIFLILLTFFYSLLRAISWVPMWSKDLVRVLNLAQIKSGQKFYDLGCGDGKMVLAAAKVGAQAEGFEISVLPYLVAKIRQLVSKEKIKIKFKDFWLTDLSQADVVFFFLIPRIYPKLKNKLNKELKPGTKVIAYVWPIDGLEPVQIDKVLGRPTIYLYQIK